MSRARRLACSLALVCALVALAAWPRGPVRSAREPDPRVAIRRERSAARRAHAEAESHERDASRARLARACEALAAHPLTPRDEAAALRFEAARWWSAAGAQRAQVLWQALVDSAEGDSAEGDVRRRSQLALGHVARRVGELPLALERYEDVALDARASAKRRDEARWWCARTHELRGDVDEAERAWSRLAYDAWDPCTRVRALDRLGCSLLARGALERARETLSRCELASAPWRAEHTPTGVRVRASFDSMVLRRRLEGTTR